MDIFFKICGGVLTVCVICLLIEKKEKDLALLLTLITCCCVGLCVLGFLEPVLQFVRQLEHISSVDSQVLHVIYKVVGIGVLAEISSLICQDAGRAALAKMLQAAAAALILWLSLPLFTKLLELVSGILNEL